MTELAVLYVAVGLMVSAIFAGEFARSVLLPFSQWVVTPADYVAGLALLAASTCLAFIAWPWVVYDRTLGGAAYVRRTLSR